MVSVVYLGDLEMIKKQGEGKIYKEKTSPTAQSLS